MPHLSNILSRKAKKKPLVFIIVEDEILSSGPADLCVIPDHRNIQIKLYNDHRRLKAISVICQVIVVPCVVHH